MRRLNRTIRTLGAAALCTALLFSCRSTRVAPPAAEEQTGSEPVLRTYRHPGLKIEAEDMTLSDTEPSEDTEASGLSCVPLPRSGSSLCVRVRLSPGRYELLVKEKAQETDRSYLTVRIDDAAYSVYPSNPPLGVWELTTRSPVYITVEEETVITVTVSADGTRKSHSPALLVDYVQLVRE